MMEINKAIIATVCFLLGKRDKCKYVFNGFIINQGVFSYKFKGDFMVILTTEDMEKLLNDNHIPKKKEK